VVSEAIEEFLTDRSPDDVLLLHFSCHGIKDLEGELYFAMTNTKLRLLAATAVAANFVNRRMTQSRSRRIVLFLDCCYAGAFERGMTARATKVMDLEERFSGRGRAVITASGAVEYAFEGGALTESGDPPPSIFTTAMVRGLATGEADRDQDGYVDLDELYDYVYDAVREVTPHQTPGKWTFGVQGDLVLARRATPVTEPSPLPPDLQISLDSPLARVRAGAVEELARLLNGRHQGLALAARQALEGLAQDDSRAVAASAGAVLAGTPSLSGRTMESGPTTAPPQAGDDPGGADTLIEPPEPVTAPAATGPPHPPTTSAATGRSRRRGLAPTSSRARILAAVVAVLLVAGAIAAWRLAGGTAAASTTIPASFDGRWAGQGIAGDGSAAAFDTRLVTGLNTAQMTSVNSACYSGSLAVTRATDSALTMRFTPQADGCNTWTVVFSHSTSDQQLTMSVDPDSTVIHETRFQISLTRQA
jgi:hypothetical protein